MKQEPEAERGRGEGGKLLRAASGCLECLDLAGLPLTASPLLLEAGNRQEQVSMEEFSCFLPKMTQSSRF